MRTCKMWIAVLIVVVVVTDCHPNNDTRLYQNQKKTDAPRVNQINSNDGKEKKNSNTLNSKGQHSTQSPKMAPMVDDDLLEFLVRVADNPAEWNKIKRVLNMLGQDEARESTATATATTAATTTTTTSTRVPRTASSTSAQPPAPPSWPSGQWIRKLSERLTAVADAKLPYDYDDEGTSYDDEFEEIEPPPPDAASPPAAGPVQTRYEYGRAYGRTYVVEVVNGTRGPLRHVVADPETGEYHEVTLPKSSK